MKNPKLLDKEVPLMDKTVAFLVKNKVSVTIGAVVVLAVIVVLIN